MLSLTRVLERLTSWAGYAASALMLPLTLITVYEVIMRYILHKPTIWAWDLNIQVFAAINMLGGAYTLKVRGHVAVDALVCNMNPKKRAILDMGTSLFFFLGMVVILVGGWKFAWMSVKAKETMPTVWAPPYYTMKMLLPIGALLMLLQGICNFIKDLNTVHGNKENN